MKKGGLLNNYQSLLKLPAQGWAVRKAHGSELVEDLPEHASVEQNVQERKFRSYCAPSAAEAGTPPTRLGGRDTFRPKVVTKAY